MNINGKLKNKVFFILLLLFLYIRNIGAENGLNSLDIKIKADTLQLLSSARIQSFQINTSLSDRFYKESFKIIPSKVNIYDIPYSLTANYPNYKRLGINTAVLSGAGIAALGVLSLLPQDATSWNKKEITDVPPFKRWWRNIRKGPVVDKDNFIFNYILHPYGGAVYYMGARSQGFNLFYSFLYSAAVSTFFWEYGIEAFMEVPSIQDLIVTPVAGTILGEGFYLLKRYIVNNDYKLFGSGFLGNVAVFLVDPLNEIVGLFGGDPNRKKKNNPCKNVNCTPWMKSTKDGKTFGVMVNLTF